MAPRPIFGSPISRKASLQAVSVQLSDWFDPHLVRNSSIELRAVVADLPDLKLSYQRDRRLFSRTLQLVVEASMSGLGPSDDATLAMRTQKLRRRWELEWSGPNAEGRESVPDRFTRAGLVEG